MNKHQIDEALNEAYKKGWDDAFLILRYHNSMVQGLIDDDADSHHPRIKSKIKEVKTTKEK